FLLNAASYIAVILALAGIRLPAEPALVPGKPFGGFHALAKTPGLLTLVLLAGLVATGGWPLLALLPSLADRVLGRAEGGYGTLLSAVGVGALLAALTAATIHGEV